MFPDWLLQLTWFCAGVCATGGFWYFLTQKNYVAALWMGFGAVVLVLLGISFHIHNTLVRRAETATLNSVSPPASGQNGSPAASPTKTALGEAAETSELEEARIATSDSRYSAMTMEEFFDAWYNKSTTGLQREELERRMLDRRVIWSGIVKSVEAESDTLLRVTVEPIDGSYGTAFLDFDQSQRQELLGLDENQRIRFTGVIRSYVASPFLKECKLLRVLP
jgi:hypothetical protein